jgi:transposase
MTYTNCTRSSVFIVEPVDFRKGIDRLVSLTNLQLKSDPFSGHVFVFCNKRRTAVKILVYDGNGFWLCLKRFSKGKLAFWPKSVLDKQKVTATELTILLQQGNPKELRLGKDWKKLH